MTAEEDMYAFLKDSIKGLSPTRELFAGKKFLEIHLNEKGVHSTIAFINKILDVLDDEEALNANIDFDKDELSIFKRSSFNLFTRRNFLQTAAWGLSGGIFGISGAVMEGKNLAEYVGIRKKEPIPEAAKTDWVTRVEWEFSKHVMPIGELLCSAGLINEAIEKRIELKLDQVARAVTQYADRIHEKYPELIIQP